MLLALPHDKDHPSYLAVRSCAKSCQPQRLAMTTTAARLGMLPTSYATPLMWDMVFWVACTCHGLLLRGHGPCRAAAGISSEMPSTRPSSTAPGDWRDTVLVLLERAHILSVTLKVTLGIQKVVRAWCCSKPKHTLSVVLKVMLDRPSSVDSALLQALTYVHHSSVLAQLANHSACAPHAACLQHHGKLGGGRGMQSCLCHC